MSWGLGFITECCVYLSSFLLTTKNQTANYYAGLGALYRGHCPNPNRSKSSFIFILFYILETYNIIHITLVLSTHKNESPSQGPQSPYFKQQTALLRLWLDFCFTNFLDFKCEGCYDGALPECARGLALLHLYGFALIKCY